METIMILEQARRQADLTEQLSEALVTAAICADEIRAIVHAELGSLRNRQVAATETSTRIRPGMLTSRKHYPRALAPGI